MTQEAPDPDLHYGNLISAYTDAIRVSDFKATLVDGAFHEVDSNALTFDIAARASFRELASKGAVKRQSHRLFPPGALRRCRGAEENGASRARDRAKHWPFCRLAGRRS